MKTSELGEVFMKDHMDSITSDRSAAEHPAPRTPLMDAFAVTPEAGTASGWREFAGRMEADRAELAGLLREAEGYLESDRTGSGGRDFTDGLLGRIRSALQKVKP